MNISELLKGAKGPGWSFREVWVCGSCSEGLGVELGLQHEGGAVEWGELRGREAVIWAAERDGLLELGALLSAMELPYAMCDSCLSDEFGESVVRVLLSGLRAEQEAFDRWSSPAEGGAS